MARIKKRICCLMLSVFYMVSSVCVALIPAMEVKASIAIGAEQTIQMLQILYSALVNGMIISGATQADYTDADTAIELLDAYMNGMAVSVGMPSGEVPAWVEGSTFTMQDGTVFTVGDVVNQVAALEESELGTGTWGKVGLTKEALNQRLRNQFEVVEGGGSGTGENPNNNYNLVSGITIGAGFVGMISDIVTKMYSGAMPDIANAKDFFYAPGTYDGIYSENNTLFHINFKEVYKEGPIVNKIINYDDYYYGLVYQWTSNELDIYNISQYRTSDNRVVRRDLTVQINDGTTGTMNSVMQGHEYNKYAMEYGNQYFVDTNLPIFANDQAMINYYVNKNYDGMQNKPDYIVDDLLDTEIEPLKSYEGKNLKPSAFDETYAAIDAAYQNEVVPQLESDPNRNTAIFTEAVSEAVSGVEAQIEMQPNPNLDPGLDPLIDPVTVPGQLPIDIPIPIPSDNPITIPQSDIDLRQENASEAEQALDEAMNGARYQYNLNDVFPFCIPFDYIALLKALSADPKTPSFTFPFVVPSLGINNNYEISLSWMNSVMEIVRTCEIVAFIIFLMSVTFKTIKW